jgi:hypothetical protein
MIWIESRTLLGRAKMVRENVVGDNANVERTHDGKSEA